MVQLNWNGPIAAGNLPDRDRQDDLVGAHIYVFIQEYSGFTTFYIGQSKQLLNRLWEHYKSVLGLHSYVRNDEGECVYNPSTDYMLEELNRLADSRAANFFDHVLDDFCRLKLCYAKCYEKHLDPVESTLIAHGLKNFPADGPGRFRCDNGRQQHYGSDAPITVRMNLDHVADEVVAETLKVLFSKFL